LSEVLESDGSFRPSSRRGSRPGAQTCEFAVQIGELKERMETVVGRLPVARVWAPDTVTYRGSFVVHDGSTWQAVTDTAKRPGENDDWVLIAAAGKDGRDGQSLVLRGAFDLRDSYSAMDVVAYEGQGYIATRDNQGVPRVEDGWLLIAARGVRGERGEPGKVGQRGHKGDRGPAGATIEEWRINREHFCVVPFYSDGTAGPPLRLRDLFQEFINQTG
jgi:hypothetical protein